MLLRLFGNNLRVPSKFSPPGDPASRTDAPLCQLFHVRLKKHVSVSLIVTKLRVYSVLLFTERSLRTPPPHKFSFGLNTKKEGSAALFVRTFVLQTKYRS
jgi:hypothetical protein